MAQWNQGYVTDVPLPNKFYRELTPTWLSFVALMNGQPPPDMSGPFRYADLGCGMGLTALAVAALHPRAEVWGYDFNPANIETARALAADAGLGNVRFVEASFEDLAADPPATRPDFAFMVAQSVLHTLSPRNQRLMSEVIGQRLQPGGLACITYNVMTGLAPMLPVLQLGQLLVVASRLPTALAVQGIQPVLERLKRPHEGFSLQNSLIDAEIATLRTTDPGDLANIYGCADWWPLRCTDVMDLMADAKCALIGSAVLADNVEALSVPAEYRPVLAEFQDRHLRETLKDFGVSRQFRQDVYRRGVMALSPQEHGALLDQLRFVQAGALPTGGVAFRTVLGDIAGRPDRFDRLFEWLGQDGFTFGEARTTGPLATLATEDALAAVALLVSGGFAHPLPAGVKDASGRGARALNAAIARVNARGGRLGTLVAPAIGSGLAVDPLETLIIAFLRDGVTDPDLLVARLEIALRRTGRTMEENGQRIEDPAALRQALGQAVRTVIGPRAVVHRRLGILEPDLV